MCHGHDGGRRGMGERPNAGERHRSPQVARSGHRSSARVGRGSRSASTRGRPPMTPAIDGPESQIVSQAARQVFAGAAAGTGLRTVRTVEASYQRGGRRTRLVTPLWTRGPTHQWSTEPTTNCVQSYAVLLSWPPCQTARDERSESGRRPVSATATAPARRWVRLRCQVILDLRNDQSVAAQRTGPTRPTSSDERRPRYRNQADGQRWIAPRGAEPVGHRPRTAADRSPQDGHDLPHR
jgi:hypothetical protein